MGAACRDRRGREAQLLIHIREYEEEDWPAVCAVYDLAKPDELSGVVDASVIRPLSVDLSALDLFRSSVIVVAQDHLHLMGFAGFRDSNITWLFVHPRRRREGVATALLNHVLARMRPPVTLNVASGNSPANALYEGLGFRLKREFIGQFDGHPCLVRTLELDNR